MLIGNTSTGKTVRPVHDLADLYEQVEYANDPNMLYLPQSTAERDITTTIRNPLPLISRST